MPGEKVQQYSPHWSDEQLIDWDDNFKDDGTVMLGCSERDIDVEEYRRALEQSIAYRNRVRPELLKNRSLSVRHANVEVARPNRRNPNKSRIISNKHITK
jgi:hypothetical protein